MYAGAGSGPFLTAAHAWDAISAQLAESAAGFRSTVLGLAASWRGPSADAMTASALAYAAWLTTTAAQAEHTANAARAAAAAYESARAATVPPALVAANRAQLRVLVATNLLGQNTAAIAATEAAYLEMWAQDVAAMADYQLNSAAATQLTPFEPPSQITHLAAKPQTPGAPGAAQQILTLLNPSGTPTLGLDDGSLLGQYLQAFLSSGPYEIPIALLSMFNVLWAVASPASPITQALNRLSAAAEASAAPGAPGIAVSSVRAAFGGAARLGPLSVPRQWWAEPPTGGAAPAAPAVRPLPTTHTPVPLPAPLPVARAGTPPKQPRPEPEYGGIVRFVTRPPAGG
ncbi:PPE family protein [Mycobacterium avium]